MEKDSYSICEGTSANAKKDGEIQERSSRHHLYSAIFVAISSITVLVIIIVIIPHLLRTSADLVNGYHEKVIGKYESFGTLEDSHNMTSSIPNDGETNDIDEELMEESTVGGISKNTYVTDRGNSLVNNSVARQQTSSTVDQVNSLRNNTRKLKKKNEITTDTLKLTTEIGRNYSSDINATGIIQHWTNITLHYGNTSYTMHTSLPNETPQSTGHAFKYHGSIEATTVMGKNVVTNFSDTNYTSTGGNKTAHFHLAGNSSHVHALNLSLTTTQTQSSNDSIKLYDTAKQIVMGQSQGIHSPYKNVNESSINGNVHSLHSGNSADNIGIDSSLTYSTTSSPIDDFQDNDNTNATMEKETSEWTYSSTVNVIDRDDPKTTHSPPLDNLPKDHAHSSLPPNVTTQSNTVKNHSHAETKKVKKINDQTNFSVANGIDVNGNKTLLTNLPGNLVNNTDHNSSLPNPTIQPFVDDSLVLNNTKADKRIENKIGNTSRNNDAIELSSNGTEKSIHPGNSSHDNTLRKSLILSAILKSSKYRAQNQNITKSTPKIDTNAENNNLDTEDVDTSTFGTDLFIRPQAA
ncbi:asparagine-rich protein-like [Ischnura elegans]|uniref:asparagine-rich protein-like n=1 Tax=Ischnura elegans TaxID=197161 RepID=UPI001ED88FF6|nr:asparagine-rich protein-like [Ischnura elegans]